MKTLNFVILAMIISFSLTNCKKDNSTPSNANKIKSIVSTNGTTTSYSYDSNGRLISLIRKDSSGTYYENINYLNSKTIIIKDSDNHEPVEIQTLILNSNGFATKSIVSGRGSENDTILYSYDSNNFQVYNGETLTELNGNVIKKVMGNEIVERVFYTDKPNYLLNSIGVYFFGNIDKNLIQQETTNSNTGDLISKITYTYEFDSSNRVSKGTSVQTNNSGLNIIINSTITYY